MDEFYKLRQFYWKYDRIQYLALRVEEVRKKLLTDDWTWNLTFQTWSKNSKK